MSDYSDDDGDSPEVMFFNLHITSLPLNFSVIINPIMAKAINLPESGASLLKGPTGKIVGVKAIGDPDCPQTDLLVPQSILFNLEAAVGDSVPMLAFNSTTVCEAIKVQPLFDDLSKSDYSSIVTKFIQNKSESYLIAPDSIFYIDINNTQKPFLIQHTIPDDRCFTTSKTKVYFSDPRGSIEESAPLPIHFSDLILRKSVKEIIRNCLWLPIHEKELFSVLNMPTSNAIMVYGSSGNGKTSFLSAVSTFMQSSHVKFVNIKKLMAECTTKSNKGKRNQNIDYDDIDNMIFSKFKEIFDLPKPKKSNQTDYLILLDDLDCFAKNSTQIRFSNQRRLLACFYSLLDKALLTPNVAIVATAKSPSDIDDNLINPSRFGYEINLDMPSLSERTALLKMFTRSLSITTSDINVLASQSTPRMSRGQIREFCYRAIQEIVAPNSSFDDMNNIQMPSVNEIQQKMVVYALRTDMKIPHFEPSMNTQSGRRGRNSIQGSYDDNPFGQQRNGDEFTVLPGRRRSNGRRQNFPFDQQLDGDPFPSMDQQQQSRPQRKQNQEAMEELRRLSAENVKNAQSPPGKTSFRQRNDDPYDDFETTGLQRRPMAKTKRNKIDPFAAVDNEPPPSQVTSSRQPYQQETNNEYKGNVADDVDNPFAPQQQPESIPIPEKRGSTKSPFQEAAYEDDDENENENETKANPFGMAAALPDGQPFPTRKYRPPADDS